MSIHVDMNVPRISLARLPTPLVPLHRFSQKHNIPTIWLKRDDLTDTAASGNKLRKLEFCVARALAENATVLITCGGVQSNHCRSTAIVASQLGLKSHLILRGRNVSPADGNLLLDRLVGANITFTTSTDLDAVYAEISDDYLRRGEKPFSIPIGASDEVGLWGYIEAAGELKLDFADHDINPGYIVSAAGSGGTCGGLILGRHLYQLTAQIHAFNVCDDEDYFVGKISQDFRAWEEMYSYPIDLNDLPINIIDGYVGPGYGKAEPPVFQTIKDLASTEGVIFDPVYTGKAFHGLLEELKKGRFNDTDSIVFIHTGGIFGLFPQKDQLSSVV